MRNLYVLFFWILISCSIGQENILESIRREYQVILEKPLLVVLETEDEEFMAKLSKKGKIEELQNYRTSIRIYNEAIKGAVEKYLDIIPEVHYVNEAKMERYRGNDFEKMSIIRRVSSLLTTGSGQPSTWGAKYVPMKPRIGDYVKGNTKDRSQIYLISSLKTDKDEARNVFWESTEEFLFTSDEIYFAILRIRQRLDDILNKKGKKEISRINDEIRGSLKDKTLIVRKADLADNTGLKQIKEVYPFKFEIVDKEVYLKKMLEQNEQYLFLYNDADNHHRIYDSINGGIYLPALVKCKGKVEAKHFVLYTTKNY